MNSSDPKEKSTDKTRGTVNDINRGTNPQAKFETGSPSSTGKPGSGDGQPSATRAEGLEIADEIARETAMDYGNGNRESLDGDKSSDAQHGGPDLEKARNRQPPDATRTDS